MSTNYGKQIAKNKGAVIATFAVAFLATYAVMGNGGFTSGEEIVIAPENTQDSVAATAITATSTPRVSRITIESYGSNTATSTLWYVYGRNLSSTNKNAVFFCPIFELSGDWCGGKDSIDVDPIAPSNISSNLPGEQRLRFTSPSHPPIIANSPERRWLAEQQIVFMEILNRETRASSGQLLVPSPRSKFSITYPGVVWGESLTVGKPTRITWQLLYGDLEEYDIVLSVVGDKDKSKVIARQNAKSGVYTWNIPATSTLPVASSYKLKAELIPSKDYERKIPVTYTTQTWNWFTIGI